MTADLMFASALGAQQPDAIEHTYTYLFCDLLTDTLIAELPLTDVSYGTILNGIGTLRGHVPYADETLPLDPEAATVPGRTAVYVDRDGVIVWAGILWTRTPSPSGPGRDIQCAEFLSYYQRRYIKETLSTDAAKVTDTDLMPNGQRLYTEQMWLVWSLLVYAHNQPSGNSGISTHLLTGTPTGISRTATYPGHERHEIYKAISDLAQAEDGFDFGVEVGWTSAANNQPPRRYKRHRIWYPRRGRTAANSGLVFAHGGTASSIVDYNWPENATELATETSGIGEGDGEDTLQATAQATDLLNSGWPLLESVTRWDGVTQQAQLQALTNGDVTAKSRAMVQPRFTVEADADPAFGSYQVGDEALFVIEDSHRMPGGREQVLRIVTIDAIPSRGPERVTLTCTAV
jgi:hypothetical protein